MENNNSNTGNSETKQSNKAKVKTAPKKIIKIIVLVLMISGIGVGGFYGYKFANRLNSDVASNTKVLSDLQNTVKSVQELATFNNNRVDVLTTTQAATQNNYTVPTPTYANITIEKVLEDKNIALESGIRFLLLDVKLENKTQNDIYFSTGELKLKDPDNYEYIYYAQGQPWDDFVKEGSKVLLPDNRIPFSYTSIKPGEIVKGTVVYVINRPGNKFSLIRNGELLKNISL